MLHRPYIRKSTRQEVENRAEKNAEGKFLDANTGKPIENNYHLGHKPGHEFRYEKGLAEDQGLTQKQFNDKMNNSNLYQIEDPQSNMSHKFESDVNPYESKGNTTAEGGKVQGFSVVSITEGQTGGKGQAGGEGQTSGEGQTGGESMTGGEEGGEEGGQSM